jgi:NYN domain/OST-HTH/LOTUS domain
VPEQPNESYGSVFVDFENVLLSLVNQHGLNPVDAQNRVLNILGKVDHLLNERKIRVVLRRAFADWGQYPTALGELYRMGYRIENVGATIRKNSADIELSLAVQEAMMKGQNLSSLVIVAGDRDYIPIAMRALENAKNLLFVSFEDSLSGELKALVGPEGYLYVDPVSGELKPPIATKAAKGTAPAKVKPLPGGLTADEGTALKAAIQAYDEYKPLYGDVRLSGFLVDALAKTLPALSHLERKQVFSSLVKKGIILTSQKQNEPFGDVFAVFSVAEDHPAVKAARETPAVQAASQRLEATLEQGRELLIRAVKVAKDKNGNVKGAPLSAALRSLDPEFDPKDYHVSKLADFIGLYPDVLELEGSLTATDPTYKPKV